MKHFCPMCGEQWNEDRCATCGWEEDACEDGGCLGCAFDDEPSGLWECYEPEDSDDDG